MLLKHPSPHKGHIWSRIDPRPASFSSYISATKLPSFRQLGSDAHSSQSFESHCSHNGGQRINIPYFMGSPERRYFSIRTYYSLPSSRL